MAGPGDGGAGPGADEDEALRLARAIAESKAQASKRVATIFAKSDLPDFQERPEVNWGERWELEEALATVPAKDGGAAAAAAMGMAHRAGVGSLRWNKLMKNVEDTGPRGLATVAGTVGNVVAHLDYHGTAKHCLQAPASRGIL